MDTPALQIPIWNETSLATPLPVASGVQSADVCVVGLGGSGLSAIEVLLDAGLRVVGVDRGGIAAGAAGRNGGFLLAGVADFHHRAVTRLGATRACSLYQATAQELVRWFSSADTVARRTGSLRIAADAAEFEDCLAQASAMQADGFNVEMYEGLQGKGLLFPDDGVFHPARHWNRLADALLQRGARLFGGSSVLSIQSGVVVTAQAQIHAVRTLICVDGGLERLLPALAGRVRSARLQMLATLPLPLHEQRPVYFRDGHDYWQQLDDGRIALGGGRDIGGSSEWGAPPLPSDKVQNYLELIARRQFGKAVEVSHRWAAEVAYSDNGLPIFGEVSPGLYACGAYSGTGNVLGVLCGRALARRALGQTSDIAELLSGIDE